MNKRIVAGILAHVDAGKTTCIESMLFHSGVIQQMGRVDHQNAFLDFEEDERKRGITISSKEVYFSWQDTEISIIDTPGHADFSSEMERSLQVLDVAILLINGQDGVQSHTEKIWDCLQTYQIPTILFVNKMDITHFSKEKLLEDITNHLSSNVIDIKREEWLEQLAMVNEEMLEAYLQTGTIPLELYQQAFQNQTCYPCLFGSALTGEGMEDFLDTLVMWTEPQKATEDFGAQVYKISVDEEGNRLTHLKITGGKLLPKQVIHEDEKVDQIRRYHGKQYELLSEALPGMVCAVKGFHSIQSGQGLGNQESKENALIHSFMDYVLVLPDGVDFNKVMEVCHQLMDEDPQLEIRISSSTKQIHLRLMGELQKEILQSKFMERCGIPVSFDVGEVVYQETILEPVMGVGHFEPIRHYAEVVVQLEPLPRGKGVLVQSLCPNDVLSMHFQKSILSALRTHDHRGVLTGSKLTDVKITLLVGRGHPKHTEGGDFREAAIRAVRMGLMQANSILLEPYEQFQIHIPQDSLSRVLYELEQHHCTFDVKGQSEEEITILGRGPIRLLMEYPTELLSYTKGKGSFVGKEDGYDVVVNQEELIEKMGYEPELDFENPSSSVFFEHGSSIIVPWDEVKDRMHIELEEEKESIVGKHSQTVTHLDLERINEMASGRNKKQNPYIKDPKKELSEEPVKIEIKKDRPSCMVIDGYNLIYGWQSLKEIAKEDLSTAREKLIDQLYSYQAFLGYEMIVVFDGYRRKEQEGSSYKRGEGFQVVYTKTNQTADQYIESLTKQRQKTHNLIVVSSDGLIQNAIFAHGAMRMSAKELENQVLYHQQLFQ